MQSEGGGACSLSAALPCLAVVVPVVETASGKITGWQLYAYRYRSRADVPTADKVPNAWLDSNARALYEEQFQPSNPACVTASIPAAGCWSTTTLLSSALLSDQLTLSSSGSGTFTPFEVSGGSYVLRFRAVGQRRGEAEYTPALNSDAYELRISPRNAP